MHQPKNGIQIIFAGILLISLNSALAIEEKDCPYLIFANRGASGNLPEHTLGAYAAALAMGVDYIETELVITKDGELVANHENYITFSTDVGERREFADRFRNAVVDGKSVSGWFVEDFTLKELKTLRAIEPIPEIRPSNAKLNRAFSIATFNEILDLIKAMEFAMKRQFGLCVEIKHSSYFKSIGLPMEDHVVDLLRQKGFRSENVYIASTEITPLKMLRNISEFQLMQLFEEQEKRPHDQVHLGSMVTYGNMATKAGLAAIAKYAHAVGPQKGYIISNTKNRKMGSVTSFVDHAHASGLMVFPLNFQAENFFLPARFHSPDDLNSGIGDLAAEIKMYLNTGIDGVFTANPNIALRHRGTCRSDLGKKTQVYNPIMSAVRAFGNYIFRSWNGRRYKHH